jgi:transitional endoplasmic reticulum ATPase
MAAHDLERKGLPVFKRKVLAAGKVPKHRSRRAPLSVSEDYFEMLAALTGLTKPPKEMPQVQAFRLIQKRLKRRIQVYEKRLSSIDWRETIEPNISHSIQAVGNLLRLDEAEQQCLGLLLMLQFHENLSTAVNLLGDEMSDQSAINAIVAMLGIDAAKVANALSVTSRLMSSQLIRWDHHNHPLSLKFDWVSRNFAQEMLQPSFDPMKALRDRIVPSPTPTITWDRFAHLGELPEVMRSYVGHALDRKKLGVNLLLYGPPGTGKSEFSRALAHELDCALFEVSSQDEEGNPVDGARRLAALKLLHGFCGQRRTMVVFDEIEDVFPKAHPLFGPQGGRYKGWVNRILENNPTVTLWITNSVESLDPAYVRRFDMVFEFKAASLQVREAHLRGLPLPLSESAVKTMASCASLSPAVVNRAAAVVCSIRSELSDSRAPQIMELIVNQTLHAQGHKRIRSRAGSEAVYDAAYINADFDPVALVEGIRSAKSARLCLYGPPGTGKTAYGQWLAQQLGQPIIVKRASDLLSQYVGMAEKNIAKAFDEAKDAGAILLMDEVDSFLQERTKAQRSWEITQVNEFLTQLEQFEGVFIATTNLMDGLDKAALRRFDFKARFDYLKPRQATALFVAHLSTVGVPIADSYTIQRLETLTQLTPGDFSVVARQHSFKPITTSSGWVSALEAECSQKPGATRRITGFAGLANAY